MTAKLGPYDLNTIVTGDARQLAEAIPDESVDLVFTDPVYDRIDDYRWLAETAARVLKVDGHLLTWQNVRYWYAAATQLKVKLFESVRLSHIKYHFIIKGSRNISCYLAAS